MCAELNVPFLGSVPVDPLVTRHCDEGTSAIETPSSCVDAIRSIVKSRFIISSPKEILLNRFFVILG